MKYRCVSCGEEFNEPEKLSGSRFIRMLLIQCPECEGRIIELTEHGKLLIERKAKIDKIKNNKT